MSEFKNFIELLIEKINRLEVQVDNLQLEIATSHNKVDSAIIISADAIKVTVNVIKDIIPII